MIDTTVLIDLERGAALDPVYAERIPNGPLRVSLISIAELQVGIEYAKTPEQAASRKNFLELVLNEFTVEMPSLQTAIHAGRVMHQLQSQGQRIGMHDSWIAATALGLGVPVVTANVAHFSRIRGLHVIPWLHAAAQQKK
ncbi:MAG: vapC [Myxococcaceae bacterium]|nr:vapC [Myxococcaceae bacterium]